MIPIVEECKCGSATIKSVIYCIRKDNIDLSGIYEYSVDILGINVYKSTDVLRWFIFKKDIAIINTNTKENLCMDIKNLLGQIFGLIGLVIIVLWSRQQKHLCSAHEKPIGL